MLGNEGIPIEMERNSTYQSLEPHLHDLLSCHDDRIRYQPNSIRDADDGKSQLAALTMMRAVLHRFVRRVKEAEQCVLTLTDLHDSNIFVDEEWHITGIIDLEWACSVPVQLQ